MAHVALVGKPSRLRFLASSRVNLQSGLRVTIHTNLREVRAQLESRSIKAVCLVSERFSESEFGQLSKLKQEYPDVGVLLIGSGVPLEFREKFRRLRLKGCALIDSVYELEDLRPILKKLSRGQSVFVREHFRHRTNQDALLNTPRIRQNKAVKIRDISQGGLMGSYKNLKLSSGELVHILVAANDRLKQHRIVGRVAWVNPSKGLFGVKFDSVSAENISVSLRKLA